MKIRADWRNRLAALVEGKEWAPISRRAKLSSTYLRDTLEKGTTPQLGNAEKLSDALGVKLTDWFLEAPPIGAVSDALSSVNPVTDLPKFELMPRNFPVYGSAQCGEDGAFEFNTGDVVDYVRRPPRLAVVRDAYALYLTGSSMEHWGKEGDLIYVNPGQPPKIGDHVVIQIRNGKPGEPTPRAFVKRLDKVTATEIAVSQYNPPKQLKFKKAEVISIHRVVPWGELLGN